MLGRAAQSEADSRGAMSPSLEPGSTDGSSARAGWQGSCVPRWANRAMAAGDEAARAKELFRAASHQRQTQDGPPKVDHNAARIAQRCGSVFPWLVARDLENSCRDPLPFLVSREVLKEFVVMHLGRDPSAKLSCVRVEECLLGENLVHSRHRVYAILDKRRRATEATSRQEVAGGTPNTMRCVPCSQEEEHCVCPIRKTPSCTRGTSGQRKLQACWRGGRSRRRAAPALCESSASHPTRRALTEREASEQFGDNVGGFTESVDHEGTRETGDSTARSAPMASQ